jgi:hypothetical protein
MNEDKCLKCGKCCNYITPRKKIMKCRFLDENNLCKVYNDRIGKKISLIFPLSICIERKNSRYDYKGCPYNTNKIILEI